MISNPLGRVICRQGIGGILDATGVDYGSLSPNQVTPGNPTKSPWNDGNFLESPPVEKMAAENHEYAVFISGVSLNTECLPFAGGGRRLTGAAFSGWKTFASLPTLQDNNILNIELSHITSVVIPCIDGEDVSDAHYLTIQRHTSPTQYSISVRVRPNGSSVFTSIYSMLSDDRFSSVSQGNTLGPIPNSPNTQGGSGGSAYIFRI